MAERAVGHGSFGVVFQVCCSELKSFSISSEHAKSRGHFILLIFKKQDILSMLFCRQNAWKLVKQLR